MKNFTLSIFMIAIPFFCYAGDTSKNFSVSKMFTQAISAQEVVSNPKISFTKQLLVKEKFNVENSLPQIARNTKTNEFLFVWSSSNADSSNPLFHIKRLSPEGNPIGSEQAFSFVHGFFSITYNPQRNEFLLVYDDLFEGSESSLFTQRLTNTGKLIGTRSAFAKTPGTSNFSPKVIFNPITGGYTLLWNRSDGVVGQLLSDTAKPNGPVVMIHRTSEGLFFPPFDLAYQPSQKKLLVAYFVGINGIDGGDILLGTLDPLLKNINKSNLKKINVSPIVPTNHLLWGADIAFLPDQSGVIFFVDNNGVKRRPISLKGTLSGPAAPAFNAPVNESVMIIPTAAFSTNSKGTFGILIGIPEADSLITASWTQVLDSKGLPVGPPLEIPIYGAITHPLPVKPSAKDFRFIDFGSVSNRTASDLIKLTLKVTIP
jgi:hypothetical protein